MQQLEHAYEEFIVNIHSNVYQALLLGLLLHVIMINPDVGGFSLGNL